MAEPTKESSSSTSSSIFFRHDVFLNFRGTDTRNNFISFLHKALKKMGINVFIDDENIRFGESISPSLMRAIQGSKISIPVISNGYATSKWCLQELSLMLDCYKSDGQIILPIFFDVEPSHVRNQAESFEGPFHEYEKTLAPQIVERWRQALREVGNLKGRVLSKDTNGFQAELVDLVVERVLSELKCGHHLVACKYPIGIDPHVANLISLINSDSNDVQFVGICGPDGIGKTTVAKAVYNQILSKFYRHSFLSDIKEQAMQSKGLASLQKQLLKDISKIDIDIGDHHAGKILIKKMLCKEKVLLVLDSVDSKEQLDALVGELDWFGKGSKVIITAREQHILQVAKVGKDKIYRLQNLNPTNSLQLFSWHAFSEREPPNDYMQLSQDVARCLGGFPLTIEVLGSYLLDIRDKEVWESTLQKLEEIPDEEVERMLKIRYDNLEDECQKSMFLDSACFFIGWEKETIISIWEACGYHPRFTMHTLLKRSLLKFEYNEYGACYLSMHDQIRDMGRNIVLKENCMEPSNHNKLWSNGEIWQLLGHKGADKIKGMILPTGLQSVPLSSECFENLSVQFLDINSVHFRGVFPSLPSTLKWFRWKSCPLHSLPANFYHERLVYLDLSCSMIKQAWISRSQDENKLFHDLKVLILSYCIYLAKSPDFSLFPHLERLDLGNCRSLDNLDDSIGQLSQLKILILKCCVSLKRLPDSIGDLKSLVQLDLSGSGIEELPDTISKLIFLEEMNIRDCRSLEKLPDGVGLLEKLVILDADSCDNLGKLPTSMRRMTCLRRINLKGDGISNIPDDFSMLLNLMELKMTATLQSLPIDLSHWRYLKQLNLFKCVKLEYLPKLPLSLVELCCEDCFSLVQLPDLSLLNILAILCLEGCVNLEEIRGLEGKLSLVEVNARGCHNLTIPPRKILGQGTLLPDRPLGSFSLTAIDGIYKKRLILCLVLELPSDFRSQTIYCDISASIRQRGKTTSCVHTLRIEDVEFTTHPHIIYLHHFKGFDWFGIPLHGKDAIENLHIHQSNLRHQLSLDTDASRAYCRVKFWKLLLENMEPFQQERNRHSIAMMVAEFFIWKFENRESEQENHNRHSSDKLMAADFSNWSFENREYEHQMLNQHSSAMRVADFFDCPYVGVGGSRATARLVLENEEDEEDEAACPSPGQETETETETETGLSSNGSILIDSDDEVLLTAIGRIVLENEEEEGVSRAMERLFLRKDDDASVVC